MTYNPDHDANLATSVGFAVSLAATMRRFDVLSAILGNTQSLKGNLGVRLAKLHAAIAAGTGHYAQALYDNAFSDAERERSDIAESACGQR